jgi:ribosomal protein S18 acetylase RimI-like enzyme
MKDLVPRENPPGVVVRAMTPADRDAVAGLLLDLNRFENTLTGDRHVAAQAGHDCMAENEPYIAEVGGAMLVAEEGGRVVGVLMMAFEQADAYVRPDLRPFAHILDLCVEEASRGRGIGRLLLAEAERIARKTGRSALLVGALAANDVAIRLYENTGFRRQAIEFLKPLRDFQP